MQAPVGHVAVQVDYNRPVLQTQDLHFSCRDGTGSYRHLPTNDWEHLIKFISYCHTDDTVI